MKIAACSKDYKAVSGHAGQAKNWLMLEADNQSSPRLISQLTLVKAHTFHHFQDESHTQWMMLRFYWPAAHMADYAMYGISFPKITASLRRLS